MERRICVRGVVLRGNKLLGVRLKNYKNHLQHDNSYWCLPGGGLDPGESVLAGLEREMIEETGVKPQIGNLLYVQQFAFRGKEYLEFFFHVINSAGYLSIDLTTTTHGLKEIQEIDFVDPRKVHLLPEFLKTARLHEQTAGIAQTEVISRL